MSRRARRRGGGGPLGWALAAAGAWLLWAHPAWLDTIAAANATAGAGGGAPVGAVADIPAGYLLLYRRAGRTCTGLDWALLAGIGKVESDHGRSHAAGVRSGTNYAGAAGPMQFLAGTWRQVRAAHPDVGPNVYDPAAAVPGAAHYLCDSGLTTGGPRAGLWTYNHSTAYADQVLALAARYRSAAGGGA